MHKWVNISISNNNVKLLETDVMFNDRGWRTFNMYRHIDSLTYDNMWDFLNYLSYIDKTGCLIAGDFNPRSRKWGKEMEYRQVVALSQTLISTILACLNEGQQTKQKKKKPGTWMGK